VSAGIAKSEARRHKREGKKIGKQVQLEKLKEREHSKGIEERVRGLKRSVFLFLVIIVSSNFLSL
jgi:rRNA-processing protein EBP2